MDFRWSIFLKPPRQLQSMLNRTKTNLTNNVPYYHVKKSALLLEWIEEAYTLEESTVQEKKGIN
jgi:hypothetical protein